jgi:hypothetical protein
VHEVPPKIILKYLGKDYTTWLTPQFAFIIKQLHQKGQISMNIFSTYACVLSHTYTNIQTLFSCVIQVQIISPMQPLALFILIMRCYFLLLLSYHQPTYSMNYLCIMNPNYCINVKYSNTFITSYLYMSHTIHTEQKIITLLSPKKHTG